MKNDYVKQKIDIGIIVLHYNNIDDTYNCIASIMNNFDTQSYRVVIVDNKSPNNSGEILKEKYKFDEKIKVILCESNNGFSVGLNVGIEYLLSFYDPKYVILSNNDVEILDKHLFLHLSEEYSQSGFAVLGPMIVTPDGRCDDNPIFDICYSRENAEYDLNYWKHRLFFTKIGLERLYLFNRHHNWFIKTHKKKIYQQRKNRDPGIFMTRRENIVVHGCFIVLSKKYFNFFNGLDAKTFMYAEEDILFVHLLEKKLLSVYQPRIVIYHKGGSSVNESFKINKKKKIFLYTNYIKAIEAYLTFISDIKIQ